MKKTFFTLTLMVFAFLLQAQPPAGNANKGDSYGAKVNAEGALSLAQLSKKLEADGKVAAKVKGTVAEVCTKKGCWMIMEMPDKTKMQIKFKDYAFFVPAAIVGKNVVLEGLARQKVVSVNELKHYAEDAKKSEAEIAAITKPEKQVSFEAAGVLVMN